MEVRVNGGRSHAVRRFAEQEHAPEDNNKPVAVVPRKLEALQLDDPAITPPPGYEQDEESDAASQRSQSPRRSIKSAEGSIYDYLDALETESELQLQSLGPESIGSRSIGSRASFVHDGLDDNKRKKNQSDLAWENESRYDHSPTPSYRSASGRSTADTSHQYYVGIKEKLAMITIELNDKTKTIDLLKMARKKDKAKTKQLMAAEEAKHQSQLKEQQQKFEKELEKHLDFAQNVVADKAELAKRCDDLVAELQKADSMAAKESERFKLQLKDARERWAAQEKVRREQWPRQCISQIVKKTDEIKKSTVKALEPDIQAILTKGKADLEKAQDAAADERRKLQQQLDKEKEMALQRQKEDYERKLVDAREKERTKLMARLDAADAELQQQLSSQRRRLQEEAEIARNELYGELRSMKMAHANEIDEIKAQESKRMEGALARVQKEREELIKKYEADFLELREQAGVECEQFKTQIAAKLRAEMEKEKQDFEKQMLLSRDSKIELVIEKLQEESRQVIEKAEQKVKTKWDQERKEWERKLKQTSEIEAVWMEKNRELHEKVTKMDKLREQLQQQNNDLSQDVKHAKEKTADLAKLLREERRQHELAIVQLEKRCDTLQTDGDYARQQQSIEIATLREKLATAEESFQKQVHKLQGEHEAALANLHERVRSTIARKDQVIENLQEELHIMAVKLEKSHALIEEQRLQLFGE